MIAVQCKMARVALGFGVRELADLAHVSPDTIARLERGEQLRGRTTDNVRTVLETAGIEFTNGSRPGVRVKRAVATQPATEEVKPYFDPSILRRLQDEYAVVSHKTQPLIEAFLRRDYRTERAKEYAQHGVCRRLSTLARCIEQIFWYLPPESDEIPPRDVLIDATVYLQAFIFNVYGVLDNLAFVWVNERNVLGRRGRALPNSRIGLSEEKGEVRRSFSVEMQNYLCSRDVWFKYLEGFRHSLAHRIPLYIPPHTVHPDKASTYQDLEKRMNLALFRDRDPEEQGRLEAQQKTLMRFRPWMQHSFAESTSPVVFHVQVLADFKTVDEMCNRMLTELDRRWRNLKSPRYHASHSGGAVSLPTSRDVALGLQLGRDVAQ